MKRTHKENPHRRIRTVRHPQPKRTLRRSRRGLGTLLNNSTLLGLLVLGPILVPPGQAQLPNPFCNAFTIGIAWIGGIVGLATLVYGAQLVLRHFFGHMGADLTRGALSIAGGLFILGLLMNNGAGLAAVAQAFGFQGFTLGCGA
jgi:sterol desaturase/sphingolipid hydroxylase (fatty acid hydroxylase superfamily)